MRGKKSTGDNVNPDFNRPKPDDRAAAKAWLFQYFRQAGTLGMYYQLYPDERPIDYNPPPPPPARGRGR